MTAADDRLWEQTRSYHARQRLPARCPIPWRVLGILWLILAALRLMGVI